MRQSIPDSTENIFAGIATRVPCGPLAPNHQPVSCSVYIISCIQYTYGITFTRDFEGVKWFWRDLMVPQKMQSETTQPNREGKMHPPVIRATQIIPPVFEIISRGPE